jgi:membrane-associated phospholipid phosphatase
LSARPSPPTRTRPSRDPRLGRWAAVLWVALVACGAALAFAAHEAGPLPGDLPVTGALQRLPVPAVVQSVLYNVDLAVWFVLVAALAVALLLRRWASAAFIFLAGLAGLLVATALKAIVARPRPSAGLVRVHEAAQGYGFPSTTACLSIAILGAVVYLLWRSRPPRALLAVWVGAASALAVLVGISRVYAGEHWASDVLGGWLLGTVLLLALAGIWRGAARGRE